MAFDVFSAFRKYPVRFTALAVVGFFLTATSTQAGFEWVPAAKTAPAPAEASPPPAVPVEPPWGLLVSSEHATSHKLSTPTAPSHRAFIRRKLSGLGIEVRAQTNGGATKPGTPRHQYAWLV